MLMASYGSFCSVSIYSGIRLLATRVLLIKWLLICEVANKGTELIQNLYQGPENWLLISQFHRNKINIDVPGISKSPLMCDITLRTKCM